MTATTMGTMTTSDDDVQCTHWGWADRHNNQRVRAVRGEEEYSVAAVAMEDGGGHEEAEVQVKVPNEVDGGGGGTIIVGQG
jgi:hypothetical protein